jgi:uncharacterized protein YjaG (DUF416 family)
MAGSERRRRRSCAGSAITDNEVSDCDTEGIVFGQIRALFSGKRSTPASDDFPAVAYANALKVRIAALSDWQQAAFAASCAERLYPAYASFRTASGTDDGGLVRRALDLAWEGAATESIGEDDPRALFERCVALIPGDDADFTIPDHAEHAISSAAYALQAAAGLSPDAGGWAASVGTDALDAFLIGSGAVPWNATTRAERAQMDQRVWQHDLFQAEVTRREADLTRLASSAERKETVSELRAQAMNESLLPIDRLDHDLADGGE